MHGDLIERLEKLTGPDREVDALIQVHFEIWPEWFLSRENDAMYVRADNLGPYVAVHRKGRKKGAGDTPVWYTHDVYDAVARVPTYTASLDAAVALVERCLPGWSYSIQRSDFGKGPLSVCRVAKATETYDAIHDCAAIALLIALLIALSKGGSHESR